jgi:ribosomal-protein-alanine N-acetyltransferase
MNEGKFPVIKTERLILTLPDEGYAPQMTAYVIENRKHLSRWEPFHSEGYFAEKFWREQLISSREEFLDGVSLKLVLFADGRVIGGCNFTNIVRRAFQACYLGYGIDYRFEGKGLMYEGLKAAIDYVFNEMKLHRIMANYIPTNERSGKLLRRLGFNIEGYARDYLLIDGRWQDHILTSLTNHNLKPEDVSQYRLW